MTVEQTLVKLSQARYAAPCLHMALFALTWGLFAISSKPLLDGPAAWPFGVLFVLDLPLSAVAFGVLFTRGDYGTVTVALTVWLVVGTVWWYFLGRSIEAWVNRFRRRSEVIQKSQ